LERGNSDSTELDIAKLGQLKDFPNGIAESEKDALKSRKYEEISFFEVL